MRVGLHGLPDPYDCPTTVVRCWPPDGGWNDSLYTWMVNYARSLTAVGITPVPNFPWYNWSGARIRAWSESVEAPYCEFGNEPHPDVWTLYRKRLLAASPVLRNNDRKVILAAAQTGHTKEWLSGTSRRVFAAVDGVAVHPYAETVQGVLDILYQARDLIPDELPIYVTEVGWGIGPVTTGRTDLTVESEEHQKYRVTSLYQNLRHHAERLKLRMACWFCDQDIEDPAFEGRWQEFCGVRRKDGTHKPSWAALRTQ